MTEIKVMIETNVRLGRKYRRARNSSNGNLDIAPIGRGTERLEEQLGALLRTPDDRPARIAVARIVGRDPASLDEARIAEEAR